MSSLPEQRTAVTARRALSETKRMCAFLRAAVTQLKELTVRSPTLIVLSSARNVKHAQRHVVLASACRKTVVRFASQYRRQKVILVG